MTQHKTCANERCGADFVPRGNGKAKFCSDKCRKQRFDRTERNAKQSRVRFFERPFNSFDGEGDAPEGDGSDRFTLLADSTGRTLAHDPPKRLTTKECLEFLLDSPKKHANVFYSFGYDVAGILHDLSQRKLKHLMENNSIRYFGYRIYYLPHKTFRVSHRATGCKHKLKSGKRSTRCACYRSFKADDVFGFFQSSFLSSMSEWYRTKDPDILAMIERGKEARGTFHTWDFADVVSYNAAELVVLNEIMSNFREALREAGYTDITSWSGAGVLATSFLKRIGATKYYADVPMEMEIHRDRAFFGGRIDAGAIGESKAWEGDIQSAYPAGMCEVPDATKLTYRWVPGCVALDAGLVHLRWSLPMDTYWGPFPFREKDGRVKWPCEGEGSYHSAEAIAGMRRFPDGIEVIGSWVADGERVYPFAAPIRESYALRKKWKREKHPANIPAKLALNSLYGKCAQRAGVKVADDGTITKPKFHNLMIAGAITAHTRARLNDCIRAVGERNVIAVATDAVFTRVPFPLVEPDGLGSYEVDSKVRRIVIVGAGLYATYDADGKEYKNKRRGFGGKPLDYREVYKAHRAWKPYAVSVRRMVTLGQAAVSSTAYAMRGTFLEATRDLNPVPEGLFSAKRFRTMWDERIGRMIYLHPACVDVEGSVSAPYEILRKRDLRRDEE